MPTVLIADDEEALRTGLKAALSHHKFKIITTEDGIKALSVLQNESIDLLISDIKMPKMDGLTLQTEALKIYPEMPVILLTAYGSVETAVEAMRKGAYDFLTKPVNIDKFEMVVLRALENQALKKENQNLKKALLKKDRLKNLVGHSKVMQNLFDKIKVVAETKSTVLISGESGTGKELIASAIHDLSPRQGAPFIAVNCAALSENLLESELFGHEKGAFTGAISKKEGRFKAADKGTLFLDEISELPPHLQVKLLRVIQEKTFEPVGSSHSVKVDVRFIAATNQNLEKLVAEGKMREDFYFRLHVLKIEAPALRTRKEDIPLLVEHFIREFSHESHKKIKTLSSEALKILMRYEWPGNVRELKNTIENLVVFSKSDVIETSDLPENLSQPLTHNKLLPSSLNIQDNEKILIEEALKECHYNKTDAALKLGMSRRTLHRKIQKLGLE